MNRVLAICFMTACVALSSCATRQPTIWTKPGGNEEQFQRDYMSCRQYGMQSAVANGLAGNLFVEKWIQDEAAKCLHNLGWRISVSH